MRALISAPLMLFAVVAVGYGLSTAVGIEPHVREAVYAMIVALVATCAGVLPLFIARRADQGSAAQAGLVATMAHLFVAVCLAGAAILIWKLGAAFTYWLFAFYAVTLVVVAVESIRLVRAAPPVAGSK